ncbi:MAG TPA: FecR domain-containing protein [Methylophilaceae bacterium]|jgi:hypothetical protein
MTLKPNNPGSKIKLSTAVLALSISNTLFIPTLAAAEQTVGWRYTVRPGDMLIKLGKTHLVNPNDWKQVQKINHINDPYKIPVGTVLSIPLALVKQYPASAEVIFVSGDARLQSESALEPIKVGQKLGVGARLFTKDYSKLIIRFADGTETTMGSNSELSLNTMSVYSGGVMADTQLKLQQGQLKTRANPTHTLGNRMEIVTPSAIAAVRGTEFRVSADEKSTKQETLEGAVKFSAAHESVVVNKGYGSLAEAGKPPTAPVALLAAVNTKNISSQYYELPLKFDLPPIEAAVSYVGQIYTDTKFNQIVAETEQQTSSLSFADLPDGHYFLMVRAKDKNGIAGYDAVHAFTLSARPFGPESLYPEPNLRLKNEPPELKWAPAADAQAYLLQVATDRAFNHLTIDKRIRETSYKFASNLPSGEYFWRLATIIKSPDGEEMQGPALKVNHFTYKAPPAVPDLSQLTVKVLQNKVYVSTLPPAEGTSYSVQLDNLRNHQIKVWAGENLNQNFSFWLREYGKQTLHFRQTDSEGDKSPEVIYEFDAYPQ